MLDTTTLPDAPAPSAAPAAQAAPSAPATAAHALTPAPAADGARAFAERPTGSAPTLVRESSRPRRRWRIPTDPPPV